MSEGDPADDRFRQQRRKFGGQQPLGELLRAVMKSSGIGGDPKLRRVQAAWEAAAGVEVAAHTKITGYQRGVVTIEVDSAPLLHELSAYLKRDLLTVLRARADAPVSDLKFRLGGARR